MFGPGATLLAKRLESLPENKEELKTSDTEQNSDSEVENVNASTPSKEKRKKRGRKNVKVGDLCSIKGIKDNTRVSSEGEHSEEPAKEIKKPRLLEGENSESHDEDSSGGTVGKENISKENDNNVEALGNTNVLVEDKDKSEEMADDTPWDKVDTEGLKEEEDNILKVLLNMHEDVPLEDPGPIVSEDGEERVAGATQ